MEIEVIIAFCKMF